MEQEMKRGDSPTTQITNAMAEEKGFPAETETGEIVNIVSKENTVNGINKLVAADGRIFREPLRGEVPGLKDYDRGIPDDEPVIEDEEENDADVVPGSAAAGDPETTEPEAPEAPADSDVQ